MRRFCIAKFLLHRSILFRDLAGLVGTARECGAKGVGGGGGNGSGDVGVRGMGKRG